MAALARPRAARARMPPLLLTAVCASVFTPLLVTTDAPAPVRLPVALAFFCIAPGVAVLSLVAPRAAPRELGLVVGVSLAALTLVATAMAVTDAWYPEAATWVVAVGCVLGLGRARLVTAPRRSLAAILPLGPPAARTRRILSLVCLGEGAWLWALSIQDTNLGRISGLGLLDALPASYYAALVVIAIGFVLALSEPVPSRWILGAHVVAFVFVLHATAAILYPEPRYTWMYKHLGVIDYIQVHGGVDRHVDLYHNWPGFFALNAWFSRAAGVAPISYAAWAQVFFELLTAAALFFTVRALTPDVRVRWATVWFFLVADWVAQNYLAPQALAFALVVLTFGICLRRLEPRVALVSGGLCAGAVIVSHQLSPVMLILGVAGLWLVTRHPPLRVVAALVALEAAWIAWSVSYLAGRISLISIDLTPTARPSNENFGRGLPGVSTVAAMPKVVLLAMLLLAAAGFIRARRARELDMRAVTLLVAPLPFLPLQAYGGEILQRAFLFSLPWLAFLAACGCVPMSWSARNRVLGYWRVAAATVAVGFCMLFAYFGLEKIAFVTSDDIAVVRWYERNAPGGSVMALAAAGLPERITADYARMKIRGDDYVPELTAMRQLRTRELRGSDIPAIVDFLAGAPAERTYLAITPSMRNYARLYGVTPPGTLAHLARRLKHSKRFRLVYQHGQAYLFELLPERGR